MPAEAQAFNLNAQPSNLTEWVSYFETYFAKPNTSEFPSGVRPLRDFTDRLAELGGYITSSKHQRGLAFEKYYAKYFAWYCGLVGQSKLQLEEFIWTRFPEVCPYCGQRPCAYVLNPALRIHNTANQEELRQAAKKRLADNPELARRSLSQWFDHLVRIYPTNLHRSMGEVLDRFHEEQSELIRAVREGDTSRNEDGSIKNKDTRARILEELSDVLSWYMTLGAKVFLTIRPQEVIIGLHEDDSRLSVDFDTLIFSVYKQGCNNCKKKPCSCKSKVSADRTDLALDKPTSILTKTALATQAYEWVKQNEQFVFSDHKAVGNFMVGDNIARSKLIKSVDRLISGSKGAKKPFPVLLCAKPGSGKTFFVEQLMKELKLDPKLNLVKADLSPSTNIAATLEKHYVEIMGKDGQKFAFLDEVDTNVGEDHAYRHLLGPLVGTFTFENGATGSIPGVVWFFAASKAQSEISFKEYLQSIDKGQDFFRRFEQNGVIITLPSLESPIETIAQMFANAVAANPNFTHIDARVVYYFAAKHWSDSGALKGAVQNAASRISQNLSVMPLAAIADEPDFFTFAASNSVAIEALGDKLIKIVK